MKRLLAAGLLAVLGAISAALWLQSEPHAPPAPQPAPPPPAVIEAPPESQHPEVSPTRQQTRPRRQTPQREPRPPPPSPYVSLDQLLRLPKPPAAAPQSDAMSEVPSRDEAGDAPVRRRVRIDFSSREPLAEAPLPREWRRSEAGVTVRVDEADRLRLRGGVLVDERGEDEASREVEATPSFGLEFRF